MKELFLYFLKLGCTGFGGPIALLGLMEKHWVEDTQKISRSDFHHMVGAAKLFPGPLATLVAIRIGRKIAGITGGLVAGLCLIIPAFILILVLAYFLHEGGNPNSPLMAGLNLGGLTLSILAAIKFIKPYVFPQTLFYIMGTAILTFLYPQDEIFFILGCGVLSLLFHRFKNHIFEASSAMIFLIFFESFKASLLTFGSGIAIVPVLKAVYIDRYHWVSDADFLTALSLGQMTPGPLIILNTFLGNLIAGFSGAILATVGIFLPTFIFGIFLMPILENRILGLPTIKTFFEGMLPAVGGAIAGSVTKLSLFAFENAQREFSPHRFFLCAILLTLGITSKIHPILLLMISALTAVLGSLVGINL